MSEARYASLSGNLLARKGGAKPAMRPRHVTGAMLDDLGWNDMGHGVETPGEHVPSSISALTPAPRSAREELEPAPVPVVAQQRALADRFAEEDEAPEAVEADEAAEAVESVEAPEAVEAAEAAPAAEIPFEAPAPARPPAEVVAMPKRQAAVDGRKAAFTLRLDGARHLRLRLATAVTGRSAQQLVTAALDQFIESLPEVGTLAEQLPNRSKRS